MITVYQALDTKTTQLNQKRISHSLIKAITRKIRVLCCAVLLSSVKGTLLKRTA